MTQRIFRAAVAFVVVAVLLAIYTIWHLSLLSAIAVAVLAVSLFILGVWLSQAMRHHASRG
jgi:hypothetical protein